MKRIAFGGIELNNLPENKTRYFTRREYDDVHKFMKRRRANMEAEAKNKANAEKQERENRRQKELQKQKTDKKFGKKKFDKKD